MREIVTLYTPSLERDWCRREHPARAGSHQQPRGDSWRARGPGYNSLQMLLRLGETLRALCLVAVLAAATVAGGLSLASWRGVVRDDAGKPVSTATGKLSAITGDRHYTARTSAGGAFAFPEIVAGD